MKKEESAALILALLLAANTLITSCVDSGSPESITYTQPYDTTEAVMTARDTLSELNFNGETLHLFIDREMLIPEYNT